MPQIPQKLWSWLEKAGLQSQFYIVFLTFYLCNSAFSNSFLKPVPYQNIPKHISMILLANTAKPIFDLGRGFEVDWKKLVCRVNFTMFSWYFNSAKQLFPVVFSIGTYLFLTRWPVGRRILFLSSFLRFRLWTDPLQLTIVDTSDKRIVVTTCWFGDKEG